MGSYASKKELIKWVPPEEKDYAHKDQIAGVVQVSGETILEVLYPGPGVKCGFELNVDGKDYKKHHTFTDSFDNCRVEIVCRVIEPENK